MTDVVLLQDRILFEHRHQVFEIKRLEPALWSVASPDGELLGSLILISEDGESDDPVYGGRLAGSSHNYAEGSDWRGIVSAVINDALDADVEDGVVGQVEIEPR